MTQYIKDFKKVCKVSEIISAVCELQEIPALGTLLLDKWEKIVFDCQEYGEDSFFMAQSRFVTFLKSGTYVSGESPLALFLISTLWLIR